MNDMGGYAKIAFISYSHADMGVAEWLQRRLEAFRLPTDIHNEVDARERYLRPVFRDKSDLNTGVLPVELRRNLEESKYLILICSKSSARSQWVSDETKAFVELGRVERIIPVMITDGETPPNELLPVYLREYFAEHPESELLGVDINGDGREKALMRVVSRMIDVKFDTLWQRHKRQRRVKIATTAAAACVAVGLAYLFALPVWVSVTVVPEVSKLPTGDDITVTINGGVHTVPLTDAPDAVEVRLPGYSRFNKMRVQVASQFFETVDTVLPTGYGLQRNVEIPIRRDDSFAVFSGTVYDDAMAPIEGASVTVGGDSAVTDSAGRFEITLPLSEQLPEQIIVLKKSGYTGVCRLDETPGRDLRFIMHAK